MYSAVSKPMEGDFSAVLDKPRACALYLTDALATGRSDEIETAFREIRRCYRGRHCQTGEDGLDVEELVDILREAGLQLVAITTPRI